MRLHGVPELLTVEEAARLIRVGRTKAYAMTREWRATAGRSGLPVIAFGNVLRVPRHALEQVVGVELTEFPPANGELASASMVATVEAEQETAVVRGIPDRDPQCRARATRTTQLEQTSLFDANDSSRKV